MPRKSRQNISASSQVAACAAKRRFATKSQAEKAADYQMILKPELDLTVYLCTVCGGWHLTRQHNQDN